jgi:hypothetical protein
MRAYARDARSPNAACERGSEAKTVRLWSVRVGPTTEEAVSGWKSRNKRKVAQQLSDLESMDLTSRQYNDKVSPFATPLTMPAPGSRGSQTTLRDLASTDNRRVDRNIAPQLGQHVAMGAIESARSAGSTLGGLPPDDFLDQRAPAFKYTWPHRTYDSLSGVELRYLERHSSELHCGSMVDDEFDRQLDTPNVPSGFSLDDGCQFALATARRAADGLLYSEAEFEDIFRDGGVQWRAAAFSSSTVAEMPHPDPSAVAAMPPPTRSLTVAEMPPVSPVTAMSHVQPSSTATAMSPSSIMSALESPILYTPDTLPSSFDASPDAQLVRRLLDTRVDLTLSKLQCRALYTVATVAKWNQWSNPSSPQNRDACDVLAAAQNLQCPVDLLSVCPATAYAAWSRFRGSVITLLQRALNAGTDRLFFLQNLLVAFNNPHYGNPRLYGYIAEALDDPMLMTNPPLHADLLVYKFDLSYSTGMDSLCSHTADWDALTYRACGLDLLSLARRVISAYVKKVDSPSVTTATVWNDAWHARQINNRFEECLRADYDDVGRGAYLARHFRKETQKALRRAESNATPSNPPQISCLKVAELELVPEELSFYEYESHEIETEIEAQTHASFVAPVHQDRKASHLQHRGGRESRLRRAAARAQQQQFAYQQPALVNHVAENSRLEDIDERYDSEDSDESVETTT